MARMPRKITTIDSFVLGDALLTLNNKYPTSRLKQAHKTFTTGDERPRPGGLAKGVGNASPETP